MLFPPQMAVNIQNSEGRRPGRWVIGPSRNRDGNSGRRLALRPEDFLSKGGQEADGFFSGLGLRLDADDELGVRRPEMDR